MKIYENGVERNATLEESTEILALQALHVPLPDPAARTFKADIWRRATEEEAEVIDAHVSAQPIKLRNLFRDAAYLAHDDPYFSDLKAGFEQAFGRERADELLAPST